MTGPRYIHIADWQEFQYHKHPRPPWIRNYGALTHDNNYLSLTGNRRALLHGLWLEYAATCTCPPLGDHLDCTCLPLAVHLLNRSLNLHAKMSDYEALNHAGFLVLYDAKTTSPQRHDDALEKSRGREEKSTSKEEGFRDDAASEDAEQTEDVDEDIPIGQIGQAPRLKLVDSTHDLLYVGQGDKRRLVTPEDLARYTGCRGVRGSHGLGVVHDVLGTDRPPAGWEFPRPSRLEILRALEELAA